MVFGWVVSYMILSVLPGPSPTTSFLLCVCLTVIPLAMAELFLRTPMALRVPLLHLSSSLKIKVLQKQPCPS